MVQSSISLKSSQKLGRAGSNPKDLPYERFWPIQMLKFLARFPHEYKTWLGWGHTIPNKISSMCFSMASVETHTSSGGRKPWSSGV